MAKAFYYFCIFSTAALIIFVPWAWLYQYATALPSPMSWIVHDFLWYPKIMQGLLIAAFWGEGIDPYLHFSLFVMMALILQNIWDSGEKIGREHGDS